MKERELIQTIQNKLKNNPTLFWPLEVRVSSLRLKAERVDHSSAAGVPGSGIPDARFSVVTDECEQEFVLEADGKGTPRSVRSAAIDLFERGAVASSDQEVAILVPYLSAGIVEELKETGLSGLDLNGNYFLQAPGLCAVRLDQENQYPRSRAIKNVYAGTTSIVGRFLLRAPKIFEKVQNIHEQIQELGGKISLSTVSKALKGLADDLVIEKEKGKIQLIQPEKLLRRLEEEYRRPRVDSEWKLKLPDERKAQEEVLEKLVGEESEWVWSGESSAETYTAAPPASIRIAYTRPLTERSGEFDEYRDKRFYNCLLEEADDDFIYFNPNGHWADDVESYLELADADADERAQNIAKEIRTKILKRFEDWDA